MHEDHVVALGSDIYAIHLVVLQEGIGVDHIVALRVVIVADHSVVDHNVMNGTLTPRPLTRVLQLLSEWIKKSLS